MHIQIGENIRCLRKERGITQEQLAAVLNISSAAVSKWERNETYPDITLLQPLAFFFDVSLDKLIGYDKEKTKEEIDKLIFDYLSETETNYSKAQSIIKQAYHNYPNDYRIMSYYMTTIATKGGEIDANTLIIHKQEIEAICKIILEQCVDDEIRTNAWNMKARLLHALGNTDEARSIYEKKFANWEMTSGEKIENLFEKNAPEYRYQSQKNMIELIKLATDKFFESIFYSKKQDDSLKIIEKLGDEIWDVGKENDDLYFLGQAYFFYIRVNTELKNQNNQQDIKKENVVRIQEKIASVRARISSLKEENKYLLDYFEKKVKT